MHHIVENAFLEDKSYFKQSLSDVHKPYMWSVLMFVSIVDQGNKGNS